MGGTRGADHTGWLVCYYYDPSSGDGEKIINFDAFNGTAIDLLNVEERTTLITNIVSHQAKLAKQVKGLSSRNQ